MRFLNPAGLWLLLGIPVLIIIYLIKSQHEEHTVSSTYIWKLSERFAKKRLPFLRLRRFILFLLQLIMVILAALMAAQPVIVKGESYDYVVILDGSASMQMRDEEGRTRFEKAVKAIEKQSMELSDGHSMTVILAGDTAASLIEGSQSTAEVKLALQKAVCTYGNCNVPEALALAQAACDRSENAKVLFYTDSTYEKTGNIDIVDMNGKEWNVSFSSLVVTENGENTVFTGQLVSYCRDAEVTVGLSIDGKVVDAKIVRCKKDAPAEVVFKKKDLTAFDKAEIFVEVKDSLEADNRYAYCQQNSAKYDVLLVSEAPLYLENALRAQKNCQVTVVPSLEGVALTGKDLYVFDGIVPEEYPDDGSVVIFGTEHLPDGLNCGLFYEEPQMIVLDREITGGFLEGVSFYGAIAKEYTGLLGNRNWKYLMYCDSIPVVATTLRENGMRYVVFSFDLHNTNLPLLVDYPILVGNLLKNCVPQMMDKRDYTVGESAVISVLPGTTEVYLEYPDGSVKNLYISQGKNTLRLQEAGVYTLLMKKGEQDGSYVDFFVHIPEGEAASMELDEINIAIAPDDPGEEKEMAISGIWIWLAAAFLLVLLLEWEWYYYEQY